MRNAVVILAALVLLFTAAWVSGGNDEKLVLPRLSGLAAQLPGTVSALWQEEALDGDVARLIAYGDYWRGRPDIRVAGGQVAAEEEIQDMGRPLGEVLGTKEEAVGENPYLEPATAYYGVEWARDALIIVRWRESTNIVEPCVIGLSGERGPYQFLPSTWATTPYRDADPCDLEAATWAAAWFVKEGRWLEWTTWPR